MVIDYFVPSFTLDNYLGNLPNFINLVSSLFICHLKQFKRNGIKCNQKTHFDNKMKSHSRFKIINVILLGFEINLTNTFKRSNSNKSLTLGLFKSVVTFSFRLICFCQSMFAVTFLLCDLHIQLIPCRPSFSFLLPSQVNNITLFSSRSCCIIRCSVASVIAVTSVKSVMSRRRANKSGTSRRCRCCDVFLAPTSLVSLQRFLQDDETVTPGEVTWRWILENLGYLVII